MQLFPQHLSQFIFYRKIIETLNQKYKTRSKKRKVSANRVVKKFNLDCRGKKNGSRLIIHRCMRPDNVGMRANKKFDSQKRVHRCSNDQSLTKS